MRSQRGDQLPVGAMPVDGRFPVGTAKYEKRNIAAEIPVWDPDVCIQCGKCVLVCPHATIRAKLVPPEALAEKATILRRLCAEAGRDPASLSISTRVNNVTFGDTGDTTGRPAPLSGTAQNMIDAIKRYEDAGVHHIVLGIRGRDADAMLTTARRFVEEVRPRV